MEIISSLVFNDQEVRVTSTQEQHAVTVRAIDSAGNEVIKQVVFIVDYCRNRLDGTTVCNYEEDLKPEPDPIIVEPSYSDPPYVFVWVSSVLHLFLIILMLIVIQTRHERPEEEEIRR